MKNSDTINLFTWEPISRIMALGGSEDWRIDRKKAANSKYLVLSRMAKHELVEDQIPHRTGILIGKISGLVKLPKNGRYRVEISEYAELSIPNLWPDQQYPVSYTSLDALGIKPAGLKWKPMPGRSDGGKFVSDNPTVTIGGKVVHPVDGALTFDQAKAGLALTYGVKPSAIRISIEA